MSTTITMSKSEGTVKPKMLPLLSLETATHGSYDSDTSTSSLENLPLETDADKTTLSIHSSTGYSLEDHLSTLQSIQRDDFSNEKAIEALPRRRNRSQRPMAIQLAKALFPEMIDIAAVIRYESLTLPAKAIVRQRHKERVVSQLQPSSNAGGKSMKIQGPWAGQEIDPLDLKGPAAFPMPVEIGKMEDFQPIFQFLSQNKTITENNDVGGTPGLEWRWNTPILEFNRGIVYEDGRLDLCKKVVGPTHIGKLMESLEANHHIRHFLLGNNAISTTGAKRIAEFLHNYPDRMETWYVAGCHITHHGLSLLVPEMMASPTITNLWFKRNPLRPNSSGLLADLVLRTPHLRTLDLESTELGDEGTRRFIDAICGQPSALRHVYLNSNGIGQSASASLGKYLGDPHCALESLFLSTNPLGDAGMLHLAPGLAKNKSLRRLMCASTGLTSKGVSDLAAAISGGCSLLEALDIGASQTTKTHGQRFNHLDDTCVEALKALIMSPSLRWLNIGRTLFSAEGMTNIRTAAAQSELVYFNVSRVQTPENAKTVNSGEAEVYDAAAVPRSCSLEVRNRLVKNQAKYYPHIDDYDEFLNSEEFRFLRNTSDIRKIDSMYRTRDKRLGVPMDQFWEEGDPTWKYILEDAEMPRII